MRITICFKFSHWPEIEREKKNKAKKTHTKKINSVFNAMKIIKFLCEMNSNYIGLLSSVHYN